MLCGGAYPVSLLRGIWQLDYCIQTRFEYVGEGSNFALFTLISHCASGFYVSNNTGPNGFCLHIHPGMLLREINL